MKFLIGTILLLAGTQAAADGFVCRSIEESLAIAVYNQTQSHATRSAAVMVISDPQIGFGRRTIARFSQQNGTLTNHAADYLATVDTRIKDSGRIGENIAGTKLGYLKEIRLKLDFSYTRPVDEGDELGGTLLLTKLNGEVIEVDLDCLRYLKGE